MTKSDLTETPAENLNDTELDEVQGGFMKIDGVPDPTFKSTEDAPSIKSENKLGNFEIQR